MKIHRLLIPNRGEIAARIIRTCSEIGLESILAASDADLEAAPARLADHTVRLGPGGAAHTYLDVERVMAAAREARADGLHPGYGFLSENVKLARACREAGIIFVGPTEEQLSRVGDKIRAREIAAQGSIPIVPGGAVGDAAGAAELAAKIGFPVLIKAAGGGGGKGMKFVENAAQLGSMAELAAAEAHAAFADDRIYVERYVGRGRHIEVQILGDGHGQVIHLGTRDCSVQRRYQKLVEEAPAPGLPDRLRDAMHAAAVNFAANLEYRGAGTVEFLLDEDRGEFYFLEMNARIQVEHPVTEAVTSVDIVAEQIAIAEGGALRLRQEEVSFHGHAIECRINAEDPEKDFHPSPGTVSAAALPAGPGIRVDTHLEPGARVPPLYDSLLAKIIVHDRDRGAALGRMAAALGALRIEGVRTTAPFHAALMHDPRFRTGAVHTADFPALLAAFLARRDQPGAAGGAS